jgi:hypothetical protein
VELEIDIGVCSVYLRESAERRTRTDDDHRDYVYYINCIHLKVDTCNPCGIHNDWFHSFIKYYSITNHSEYYSSEFTFNYSNSFIINYAEHGIHCFISNTVILLAASLIIIALIIVVVRRGKP